MVMTLLAVSFISALACGWGLFALFARDTTEPAARILLAGGSLSLLHALEDSQQMRQILAQKGNTEISVLKEAVQALESLLATLDTQVQSQQKTLAELEKSSGSAEEAKKARIEEKKRLEAIVAAFKLADQERLKAQQTMMMGTLPPLPGGITAQSLDQWKKEWGDLTQEAADMIQKASASLETLAAKKDEWEKGKDSFPSDKQREMQNELRSLHAAAGKDLVAAREAVQKMTKPLQDKIAAQKDLLDAAIKSMPK